jgi:alkanesulfonate monooxygenase SsuD/methylene tetrahydromethanopterin reductase-like flavin-dependent oxidoreductase (luciferase family)
VPLADKRNAWREAVEQCANMMAMDPYPGFQGQFFSMPARNVVPKPAQKPHPPLWVACSNRETIKLAARLGIGALTFAFVDPAEASQWVDDYYRIFKEECVPIGHAVNPNIAMVSSFGLHQDAEVARQRFQEGFRFFQFALGWHYGFGEQIPGRTDIWELFQKAQANLSGEQAESGTLSAAAVAEGGIGTPDSLREHLRKFDECGVDQVAFIQQGGRNKHEHICEALELFAGEVMGEFKQREAARVKRKAEELAPFVEAAFKRKQWMKPLADDEIPPVVALGRQVAERAAAAGEAPPPANPRRAAWVEALEKAKG